MSTKCVVAYAIKNKVVCSTVNHDGYITDGVGDTLKNYYNSLSEAKWIVKLGNREFITSSDVKEPVTQEFPDIESFESEYLNKGEYAFLFLFKNKHWYYKPCDIADLDWEELS